MIWEFSACPEVSAFTARLTITRKIHKRKNEMKEELSATMWHRQHCLETYSSKTPSWSFTKLIAFYHWRSSLPPRLKAIEMGKEEELRQVDTDSHNHVKRCGNNFAWTMSTTILREWARCPVNQECRMNAKYYVNDITKVPFPPVSRRELFRTPRGIGTKRSTASYLLLSTDKVTVQQVFNRRPIKMTQPCFRWIALR